MKKPNSKKLLITSFSIIILIGLFLTVGTKTYTFEEGFNEIKLLDQKYETDFKIEEINRSVVDYKKIDPYLEELTELREDIVKSIRNNPTDNEEALLRFIDGRTLMLLSQKNYLLGKINGNRGIVSDEEGFRCSDTGYLINTAYYYNLSWAAGIEAMQEINKVLEKREYTWGLVGINENKARFFYSKLGKLKTEIGKNLIALEDFCAINMSRGLTNTVDAKSYEWIPTNTEEITKSIQEKGLNITYATQ